MRRVQGFKVTHYQIESEKLSGMDVEKRIAFLCDLHNNCYGKDNESLYQAVKEAAPDIILIGGDMLVGLAHASSKVAEDIVTRLVDICPVYYANGNHEQRMKIYPETFGTKYEEYKKVLQKAGVHFLENEHVNMQWGSVPVQIHGLEIPREGYKKFRKIQLSVEEIERRIGEADGGLFQILLAHNPTYADTYLEWGADLILSGHLHGGVMRLPRLGGIISPQFHLFPKYSGELTVKGDKSIVVSKGLGMHTIKIRLFNPPELIVLHIGGTDK